MDRRNTADHHHLWSGLRPSRGLFARASPESVLVQQQQQQVPEVSADWAPTWARSSSTLDTKNTSPPLQVGAGVPTTSVAAPVPSRWTSQPQQQGAWERDGSAKAAAQELTGLLDCHRQGWHRTESRVSETVERAGDEGPQALASKPSRSPPPPDISTERDQLPESSARAAPAEWEPTWTALESSYEPMSSSLGAALGDGALAAPTRLISDAAGGAAGPSGAEQGFSQLVSRRGWNWSSRELSSPRRRSLDQRRYRFNSSPCLESKLDEEMAVFESQLTRTLSGYLPNRTSATCLRNPEISLLAKKTSAPVVADAGDVVATSAEKKPSDFATGVSSVLKRKRADLPNADVGESWWTQPLKLLVRKELTLSDVGELGRIVLPKKDVESLSFPQTDSKEGTVLEMEEYMVSKCWYFRFKYWINNKSRMYVLENTGDFIKYHCLKERDVFLIFEDGCKKLVSSWMVVRGLKLENGNPALELSKGP